MCANRRGDIVGTQAVAVDYPLYKRARIPSKEINNITSLDGWTADEVTTPLQAVHDVFSITFTPGQEVLSQLDKATGWHFGEHSLAKIRLYGRRIDRDREYHWCVMFPIVAMNPLPVEVVAQLFESLAGHTGDKGGFSTWFSSKGNGPGKRTESSSQLRLVSFVAAVRLATIWFKDVAQVLSSNLEAIEDRRTYDYLFPPAVIEPVRHLCRGHDPVFAYATRLTSQQNIPRILIPFHKSRSVPDQTSIEKDLTAPFLRLYKDKELRARQLALRYGHRVFDRPEYRHVMNRLKTGFTLPTIRKWIENLRGSASVEMLVSLFLDRAIDRGVVVPITCVKGGRVFRAYRHGEDVEFAEAEERLCMQMLAAVSQASGREELPHVWVEKALVLLIRIGLEQQFFNAWEHTLGNFKSMGIRYSLHGAVVATGSNKLYHTVEHYGLTEVMQRHGYLSLGSRAKCWRIGQAPAAGTHPDRTAKARLIGSLLGKLLGTPKNTTSARLIDADLTLLATCLYPKDVAGALAAEIDVAARDWMLSPVINEGRSVASVTCIEADEAAAKLRRSTAFFAVSNGLWKASNFGTGKPWAIIDSVYVGLSDPVYKAAWDSLWPKTGKQGRKGTPRNLAELIDRERTWLLKFRAVLAMLECAVRFQAIEAGRNEKIHKQTRRRRDRQLQRALTELATTTAELAKFSSGGTLIHRAGQRLEASARSGDLKPDAVCTFALKQLDVLASEAKAILAEVDSIAATFGRAEELSYYHQVLHIDLRDVAPDGGSPWRTVVYPTYHEFRREARRRDSGTIVAEVDRTQCGIEYGMWLVATGPMARVWLTRIALRVISRLAAKCTIRCTLFANLRRSFALIKTGKSSRYVGPVFWENAAGVLQQLSTQSAQYRVVVDADETTPQSVNKEVLREAVGTQIGLAAETEVRTGHLDSQPLNALSYTSSQRPRDISQRRKANVGILCVVADEMKAITEFLSSHEGFIENEGYRHHRDFCEALIPDSKNSRHRVAVTRATEQGNRSIMPAYQALMEEYKPELVVLLGIGGSIHPEARVCDVVIAESIFYYDKRAETAQGPQHRLLGYRVEPWLLRYINRYFNRHGDAPKLAAAEMSPEQEFQLRLGPVGTGEAVVKYRDAEVRKWLRTVNDKTLALETEAGGVAQQFWEDTLRVGEKARGYLVLRGISDHSDHEKDDRWRIVATTNAMRALAALLSVVPSDFGMETSSGAIG